MPVFYVVVCKEMIIIPSNGVACLDGIVEGKTVNFTCDAGYTLSGSATLTCQEDGKWSSESPTCSKSNLLLSKNRTKRSNENLIYIYMFKFSKHFVKMILNMVPLGTFESPRSYKTFTYSLTH